MFKLTSILTKPYIGPIAAGGGPCILGNRFFSDQKEKKIRGKTPIGKLDQTAEPAKEEVADAYAPFPDGTNPTTGEIGGPRGPEPTRYGDWERKGRVSDF